MFDAAVFGIACISFWCQCRLAEVCVDGAFDPKHHASQSSHLHNRTTASGDRWGSFWAPIMKTSVQGQEILWTDSRCPCSTDWAFKNHLENNRRLPDHALL